LFAPECDERAHQSEHQNNVKAGLRHRRQSSGGDRTSLACGPAEDIVSKKESATLLPMKSLSARPLARLTSTANFPGRGLLPPGPQPAHERAYPNVPNGGLSVLVVFVNPAVTGTTVAVPSSTLKVKVS
jgi:hypothetical protein